MYGFDVALQIRQTRGIIEDIGGVCLNSINMVRKDVQADIVGAEISGVGRIHWKRVFVMVCRR